jgi:hypothetical protein
MQLFFRKRVLCNFRWRRLRKSTEKRQMYYVCANYRLLTSNLYSSTSHRIDQFGQSPIKHVGYKEWTCKTARVVRSMLQKWYGLLRFTYLTFNTPEPAHMLGNLTETSWYLPQVWDFRMEWALESASQPSSKEARSNSCSSSLEGSPGPYQNVGNS